MLLVRLKLKSFTKNVVGTGQSACQGLAAPPVATAAKNHVRRVRDSKRGILAYSVWLGWRLVRHMFGTHIALKC